VLPEENSDQVAWFAGAHEGYRLVPYGDVWRERFNTEPPVSADGREDTLLLTPASHGTDGFFVANFKTEG
jgi:16S rRNA (cytosine967-C5)-methyltransferase